MRALRRETHRGLPLLAALLVVILSLSLGAGLLLAIQRRDLRVREASRALIQSMQDQVIAAAIAHIEERMKTDPGAAALPPDGQLILIELAAPEGPRRILRSIVRARPTNAFLDPNSDPSFRDPLLRELLWLRLRRLAKGQEALGGQQLDRDAGARVIALALQRVADMTPELGLYESPESFVDRLRLGLVDDLRLDLAEAPDPSDAVVVLANSLHSAPEEELAAVQRELSRLDAVLADLTSKTLVSSNPTTLSWPSAVLRPTSLLSCQGRVVSPLTQLAELSGSPAAVARPLSPIAINDAPRDLIAALFSVALKSARGASAVALDEPILDLAEFLADALVLARAQSRLVDLEALDKAIALPAGDRVALLRQLGLERRLEVAPRSDWVGPGAVSAQLLGRDPTGVAPLAPPVSFYDLGHYRLDIESAIVELTELPRAAGEELLPAALQADSQLTPSDALDAQLDSELRLRGSFLGPLRSVAIVRVYDAVRLADSAGFARFARAAAEPDAGSWPDDGALGDGATDPSAALAGATQSGLALTHRAPSSARFYAPLRGGAAALEGVVSFPGEALSFPDRSPLDLVSSALSPDLIPGIPGLSCGDGLVLRAEAGAPAGSGPAIELPLSPDAELTSLSDGPGAVSFWCYLTGPPASPITVLEARLPGASGERELRLELSAGDSGGLRLELDMEQGAPGAPQGLLWSGAVERASGEGWHRCSVIWPEGKGPAQLILDDLASSVSSTSGAPPLARTPLIQFGLVARSSAPAERFLIIRDLALHGPGDSYANGLVPSYARATSTSVQASFGPVFSGGTKLLGARLELDRIDAGLKLRLSLRRDGEPLDGVAPSLEVEGDASGRGRFAAARQPSEPTIQAAVDGRLRAELLFPSEPIGVGETLRGPPLRALAIVAFVQSPGPRVLRISSPEDARPGADDARASGLEGKTLAAFEGER